MKLLIDAQLPRVLARQLLAAGHEAAHVADLDLEGAKDAAIWRRASQEGYAIVTKDEDFARRRAMVRRGPAIVWLRIPNTRRAALLRWFGAVLPDIGAALVRGDPIIELTQALAGEPRSTG